MIDMFKAFSKYSAVLVPRFLAVILTLIGFHSHTKAQLRAVPTFASCSIYFPSEKGEKCLVKFKEDGGKKWLEAIAPYYDLTLKEYRLSLVRLKENTNYTVAVEVMQNGKSRKEEVQFRTWSSNPVISKTIQLSELAAKGKRAIQVSGLKGRPEGWIRIKGDLAVDAGNEADYAIQIKDCEYVILEGANVKGGYKHAIQIEPSASNIRILNCNISAWGRIPVFQTVKGLYLDKDSSLINYDAGVRMEQVKNIVVERCYIHDPNGLTNAWDGVIHMGEFKGQPYKVTHPAGPTAVYVKYAKEGVVLRYNDFIGSHTHRFNDPVETTENGSVVGGFNKDADIYGNIMAFGQDDGIELDGGQCNIRMFDNRIEQTMIGISAAPNKRGPSYIFNNVISNLGNSAGSSTYGVKNGGGETHSKGMQYFINNTILAGLPPMMGVGYGDDKNRSLFHAWSRNNIYSATTLPDKATVRPTIQAIAEASPSSLSSYDYDMLGNTVLPEGKGLILTSAGQEANGVYASPTFTNGANGVFTLLQADKGIDKGIGIPNFTQAVHGNGVDLGAFEFGTTSLSPARPIKMQADKYFLLMKPNVTETITIKLGDIGSTQRYTVFKSADMGWLKIDEDKGQASSNTEIKIQLTATSLNEVQKGAIVFRLENGFSIPFTLKIDQ